MSENNTNALRDHEDCRGCRFFRSPSVCHRYPPIHNTSGIGDSWPHIANEGAGQWCGEWLAAKQKVALNPLEKFTSPSPWAV